MTMLSKSEREELDQLRASAAKFMTSPLERVFFQLESLLERSPSDRIDSIMPSNHFYLLAKAVLLLKQELIK